MSKDSTLFLVVISLCGFLLWTVMADRPAHADDSPNSAAILERIAAHLKDSAEAQKAMAKSLDRIADKCK